MSSYQENPQPEVSATTSQPTVLDYYYVIRRCSQCGKNFSAISDSSNSFCDKGCQENWLNFRFG